MRRARSWLSDLRAKIVKITPHAILSVLRFIWIYSRIKSFPLKDVRRIFFEGLSRSDRQIFFVQVGAMDGKFADPLYEFLIRNRWHGLLVEPLPDLFERLRETYQGRDNLIFENAAISEANGSRVMYRVDKNAAQNKLVPTWAEGIASFFNNKNALGGRGISAEDYERIRPNVVPEVVTTVVWDSLIKKHKICSIDILIVDVEGYDYKFLKQIELDHYNIQIIQIEHENLLLEERKSVYTLLEGHGYRLKEDAFDILAWRPNRTIGFVWSFCRSIRQEPATAFGLPPSEK